MTSIPYNRNKSAEYARRWALGRNPSYYNFDGLGGDCTNFCSQCIYAGAGVMNYTPNYGWYYHSINDRAPAWTSVEYLYRFLVNNVGAGPTAQEVERSQIAVGDIIQLGDRDGEYYHSLVVTKTDGIILVCAHTYDALNRPLNFYNYYTARFIHIVKVNI